MCLFMDTHTHILSHIHIWRHKLERLRITYRNKLSELHSNLCYFWIVFKFIWKRTICKLYLLKKIQLTFSWAIVENAVFNGFLPDESGCCTTIINQAITMTEEGKKSQSEQRIFYGRIFRLPIYNAYKIMVTFPSKRQMLMHV